MIVADPAEFRALARDLPLAPQALPRGVFMVEPEQFRVDAESAQDNPYMDLDQAVDPDRALAQHRSLQAAIRGAGVTVQVFPGDAATPDAVFPNNVFATVPGRLIIGSMRHPGRRREALREDIRGWFTERSYVLDDLSRRDCIAELTGPMVLDRTRGIGYCGMSERVDGAGLRAMHDAFGLSLCFAFDLQPGEYHANVVLSVLAGRACVLCPEAFQDLDVPDAIGSMYPERCLQLSAEEKNAFAANCIALTESDLFLSATAMGALTPLNRERLESWGFRLHAVELDEIEKAGGSLRCTVAEVF